LGDRPRAFDRTLQYVNACACINKSRKAHQIGCEYHKKLKTLECSESCLVQAFEKKESFCFRDFKFFTLEM
jgi:hypothetical protein